MGAITIAAAGNEAAPVNSPANCGGVIAVAATGRTKAVVNDALVQLEAAGVATRASQGNRNRIWEAAGLLDLLADLEAGVTPPSPP